MNRPINFIWLLFVNEQCIAKKWPKDIPDDYEYILEKAYALAHLPADQIPDGIQHISTLIVELANNGLDENTSEELQKFSAYLCTFWQPLAPIFLVYDLPVKTNNSCENFHVYAKRQFKVGPNIYKELDKYN